MPDLTVQLENPHSKYGMDTDQNSTPQPSSLRLFPPSKNDCEPWTKYGRKLQLP